jgi:hypothetical protein
MAKPWGRLYAGTRNHRKIKILAQRLPSLWPFWYVLIDLAIEVDDGGWIYVSPGVPYTMKELAKELRLYRHTQAIKLTDELQSLDMITLSDKGILLNSFSERNFESDNSTPRVQKYREKQKQINNDGTDTKRYGNVSVTDQNRTDTEHIKNPPTPLKGGSRKAKENGKIPYEEIRGAWNQYKPPLLPTTIALNAVRKNLIKQAWVEHPSLEWFKQFFTDINLSDHHSGRNDKNWIPEIDWILKNRLKLQEKIEAVKGRGQTKDQMDNYIDFLAERDGVT